MFPRNLNFQLLFFMISREEKWAELAFAKNPGIVIGDAPVSYWSIFPLSLVTVPEVFAKVNSAQFPSFF